MSTCGSESRLRVVHVVLQLETGGMEKLLVEFARHADRSRFDLRFVSLTTRGRVADELASLGWPVEALGLPPGLRPKFVLRLARLFREWHADVVHVHNTKPLMYCGPAARLAGVGRIVYTRHGQRHNASRRTNLLFRLAARTAHATVCVSKDSAARSLAEGLSAAKLHTVWNGIDTERFAYLGPAARGPALMVGRLSPEKDVRTLLAAVALAIREEPAFRLDVAGDGTELNGLREAARELGIGPAVRFLGHVNNVPELMGAASLCVLSSLTEGISLTLLEAMSRGVPAVATCVGGNPEIVLDGVTGLLVPPRNPERLAAAMLSVWRDPALGRQMGVEGRRRVLAHFDVRRMVGDYEKLYTAPDAVTESCQRPTVLGVTGTGAT
jgi:glycosyltransferase involved in cell wall biosynthesis